MKFKTTKKAMRDNYNNILSVGYCSMQYLLKYQEPIAYSAGTNGWACDYYIIDNVLISEGYSPLNNKNTTYDYDTLNKYESMAREVVYNYELSWEEQKELVNELLYKYIGEVSNND